MNRKMERQHYNFVVISKKSCFTMSKITYKDAGVDIEAGSVFVERIKKRVQQTCGKRVVQGVGGFASLYDIDGERYLAAGTDGVGTKLMVAQKLGIHHTIGIDLVAMCINDILCTGAKGLFFMDYLATGKLDLEISEQIMEGLVEGCMQAKVALIGGETAEMPTMYDVGTYDLAGFAVGEVFKNDVIDGTKVQQGDSIVGIASSGIHSNGLSLARMLAQSENDEAYWQELLRPTRIYTSYIETIQREDIPIHGLAHITGGGIQNINRICPQATAVVDSFPDVSDPDIPNIFSILKTRSSLSKDELYKTFNMGVGMAVVTPQPQEIIQLVREMGIPAWRIGTMICL